MNYEQLVKQALVSKLVKHAGIMNTVTNFNPITAAAKSVYKGGSNVLGGAKKAIQGDFAGGIKQGVGGMARAVTAPMASAQNVASTVGSGALGAVRGATGISAKPMGA
jgi:hypothetical protein